MSDNEIGLFHRTKSESDNDKDQNPSLAGLPPLDYTGSLAIGPENMEKRASGRVSYSGAYPWLLVCNHITDCTIIYVALDNPGKKKFLF